MSDLDDSHSCGTMPEKWQKRKLDAACPPPGQFADEKVNIKLSFLM